MTKSGVEHLAQHAGWNTKRKSKPIILFMEGGLIQSVSGIPRGIKIIVRDYDSDCDTSNPRVHKDADGDFYFENSWDSGDNQTEKEAKPK